MKEGDTEGDAGTPQEVTHVLPESVPLFGQVYTGVAVCVIEQVAPLRDPPLGQEYPVNPALL